MISKVNSFKFNRVVLQDEVAVDANHICEQLKDKGLSYCYGSGVVDTLEWKAASVIRKLLVERKMYKNKRKADAEEIEIHADVNGTPVKK